MTGDLAAAIDGLYRAFSAYQFRPDVKYCTHCHDAREVAVLAAKPLRKLDPRDISGLAFDAMTTYGDVVDYKYLLPRILELTALDLHGFAPWQHAEKLAKAEWQAWPSQEVQALKEFWTALFADSVRQPRSSDGPPSPEDVLVAVAKAGLDLAPFLADWVSAGSVGALALEALALEYDTRGELDPFWLDVPAAAGEFLEWLLDPERAMNLPYGSPAVTLLLDRGARMRNRRT